MVKTIELAMDLLNNWMQTTAVCSFHSTSVGSTRCINHGNANMSAMSTRSQIIYSSVSIPLNFNSRYIPIPHLGASTTSALPSRPHPFASANFHLTNSSYIQRMKELSKLKAATTEEVSD